MIGGKPVAPESRHTRLYSTFAQEDLNDVGVRLAPLGLERPGATASVPAATGNTGAADGASGSR